MKKLNFLIILLLISFLSFSQTINIQSGISISKLDWSYKNFISEQLYDNTIHAYSEFLGVSYFNRKYCSISSNFGYIRKGGKETIPFTDINGEINGDTTLFAKLDYLSLNSVIEFHCTFCEHISPFVSVGPRIDYLIYSSDILKDFYKANELNYFSYGLLFGTGAIYDFSNFQIGIRSDYYLNFSKIADWKNSDNEVSGKITDKTFAAYLIVGYKIR